MRERNERICFEEYGCFLAIDNKLRGEFRSLSNSYDGLLCENS